MRASALLAALALAGSAASAQDAGRRVRFGKTETIRFSVAAGGPAQEVFASGNSEPVAEEWDTVLLQGVLPDPAVRFEISRPSPLPGAGWIPLQVHRFPNGRFWAKAKTARGSGSLALRAVDGGSRASHQVEIFAVDVFLDEPTPPAAAPVPPRGPRDPSALRPPVIERAGPRGWGAASPRAPWSPDPLPWRVTLHHSDGRMPKTLEESKEEARFIQDYHMRGRGWIDIGYHFLVDPMGNILEGRPEGTLGAHTQSNNEGNIGIALLGTYHPPRRDEPTAAQLEAVGALGRYLVKRYGLDPASLKGHRDYKNTECPGDRGYARINDLRGAFRSAALLTRYAAVRFDAPQRVQ